MKKKQIVTGGLLSLSAGILGIGTLAFFKDSKTSELKDVKVGSVTMEVGTEIAHEGGMNNINPGDNDKTVPANNNKGTDHEFKISVKNIGSKSVAVKNIIKITATKGGKKIDLSDANNNGIILVTPKDGKLNVGDSSTQVEGRGLKNDPLKFQLSEDGTEMYYITDEIYLNGTEEKEAAAKDKSLIESVYDLGLAKEVENELSGADINIEVQTLALQYRNTGNSDLKPIFKDKLVVPQDVVDDEVTMDTTTVYARRHPSGNGLFLYPDIDTDKRQPLGDEVEIEYGHGEFGSDKNKRVTATKDKSPDRNEWTKDLAFYNFLSTNGMRKFFPQVDENGYYFVDANFYNGKNSRTGEDFSEDNVYIITKDKSGKTVPLKVRFKPVKYLGIQIEFPSLRHKRVNISKIDNESLPSGSEAFLFVVNKNTEKVVAYGRTPLDTKPATGSGIRERERWCNLYAVEFFDGEYKKTSEPYRIQEGDQVHARIVAGNSCYSAVSSVGHRENTGDGHIGFPFVINPKFL